MAIPQEVLLGVGLPVVLSGMGFYGASVALRRGDVAAASRLGAGGLGVGYLLSHAVIGGSGFDFTKFSLTSSAWLPRESWQYLFVVVIGTVAAARLHRLSERKPGTPYITTGVLAIITGLLVVPHWQPSCAVWMAVLAVASYVLWASLDLMARRLHAAVAPLAAMIAAVGCASVATDASSAKFALLVASIAAACGAAAAVNLWRPTPPAVAAAMPAVALVLCGVMFNSYFNNDSDVPTWTFALVLAAPLAALVMLALPLRRSPWWLTVCLAAILTAIPTVIAAIVAHQHAATLE